MSLVPDYGDSAEESEEDADNTTDTDSDSDSSAEKQKNVKITEENPKELLPGAQDMFVQKAQNVFKNPYTEELEARQKLLEKHVKKMVETQVKSVKTINGRKICFNYRKGKCKFGSKCQFFHDSDIRIEDQDKKQSTPNPTTSKKLGKRAYGPGDSLIPSKKSMKLYKTLKSTKSN